MKKLILIIVALWPMIVYGQDLIITHDAREIEAKVERIDDYKIDYRRWDNQQGPVYSIAISKVLMIKFANGSKQTFTLGEVRQVDAGPVGVLPDGIDPTARLEGDRHGNLYLNGQLLTRQQANELLNRGPGCNYADTWYAGHAQFKKGKTFLGLGLGLLGATAIFAIAAVDSATDDYDEAQSLMSVAYICAIPADVFICLGCVYRGVGRGRRNSVINRYNNELRSEPLHSQLLLGPTSAGYGLTLTF